MMLRYAGKSASFAEKAGHLNDVRNRKLPFRCRKRPFNWDFETQRSGKRPTVAFRRATRDPKSFKCPLFQAQDGFISALPTFTAECLRKERPKGTQSCNDHRDSSVEQRSTRPSVNRRRSTRTKHTPLIQSQVGRKDETYVNQRITGEGSIES